MSLICLVSFSIVKFEAPVRKLLFAVQLKELPDPGARYNDVPLSSYV